jgi:polypeptide N-acetylgalactosaminyltransferase
MLETRRGRRLKSCVQLFIFIFLFLWLVYYGFQHSLDYDDDTFGESLDRNHIEKLEMKKSMHGRFVNFVENFTTVSTHDEEILKEFMQMKKTTRKYVNKYLKTSKTKSKKSKNVSTPMTFKETTDQNGHFENAVVPDYWALPIERAKHELKTSKKISSTIADKLEKFDDPMIEHYGEYGAAVSMPPNVVVPDSIKAKIAEGWKNHEFNEYVSSFISINRTLVDFRTKYCREIAGNYSTKLPSVSVIIVFYNEANSTLLRTIMSVINRSPPELLKEIILVDDFSTFDHLMHPLEKFFENFPKIKIIRSKKREGLIHARNVGAMNAKGKVLVFLDSHVECTKGWLEPLLDRIVLRDSCIAVPTIDRINDDTFELVPHNRSTIALGGFSWDLQFRWFKVKMATLKQPNDPILSPTFAGGLFAISKKYFKHLGMYDPGLDIWGGENLELSFKTWMCGGNIEIVPCSHVGHVFRKKSPYEWREDEDVLRKNILRVANVWMDDYIKFYKYAAGFEIVDFGNISDRIELRKKLECRDFKWYLTKVYPERSIPSDGLAYGEIRNLGFGGKHCLNGKAKRDDSAVKVKKCSGGKSFD